MCFHKLSQSILPCFHISLNLYAALKFPFETKPQTSKYFLGILYDRQKQTVQNCQIMFYLLKNVVIYVSILSTPKLFTILC